MTEATEHKTWSELNPVTQAALRCKDPVFWAFLRENGYTTKNIEDEERAAAVVRNVCEITSRRELAEPSIAQAIWRDIDNSFQAWKARER
jgi:hypothetical protein